MHLLRWMSDRLNLTAVANAEYGNLTETILKATLQIGFPPKFTVSVEHHFKPKPDD